MRGSDNPASPDPRMALLALLGTLVFFALAVLGAGGPTAFLAHPARVALAIVGLALAVAAMLSGGNLSPGEREDRGNRWVLAWFTAIGLLAAYLPACTDAKGILLVDGDGARWLGVALFALGGALRLWPVFVLGRR